MNKKEFLLKLEQGLSGLPQKEIAERISFYSEMIDDRIEDGADEKDAVEQIGNVENIVEQIIAEFPMSKLIKERVTPKRKPKAWEIVCLALGSPIWISLLVAFLAVIFSLYAVVWALVITLWSLLIAFPICSIYGVVAGVIYVFSGFAPAGVWLVALALVLAGITVFLFYASKTASKGLVALTKKTLLKTKKSLIKKENA